MSASQSPTYNDYGSQADHAQGPPRKKMRKGTKSCMECRRRKIKCTFEQGRPAVCNECFVRGSTCIDQEHADAVSTNPNSASNDNTSLRERVANLEDLIKEVLYRLPERTGTPRPRDDVDTVDTQAAEVLKSLRANTGSGSAFDETLLLPGGASDAAPAFTLFDNAVIARKSVEPVLSREHYNKAKTLNAALLQLLPPLSDLELILESSQEWWVIWKTMFPQITDHRCVNIKEAVSHSLRSDKPAEIGKIMLCIALGIHQLPPYFDWSRLSIKERPDELMARFVSTVDRLITSDEEIAATIEGIECMLLEGKWHINMGRPRKAWLLTHKAIAFAQLLGLHRIANHPPPKPDPTFTRKLSVWVHLVIGERWLAMMMGLPCSVPDKLCSPAIELAKSQKQGVAEGYTLGLATIVGRMIDRNQNPAASSYSETIALDQQLEDMRNATEPSWWTTERLPGSQTGSHFERLQAQFFHHQTRVCLHQPFMLKSSADKRYEYSHRATLESAREMIKYYDALRGAEDVGPHACKIIDFQAFTAAMLLLINLCGYSQAARGAVTQQPDLDQDQHDSKLIDRTISLLNTAATEAGGIVAAHCAQALTTLAQIRSGCCGDNYKDTDSIQISIPYFGRVSITAGKQFVPIKPGTYPDVGAPKNCRPSINTQTGLPTPPSMSSSSTFQSPRESLMGSEHTRPSPYFNSSESISRGVNHPWIGQPDDAFVTFDSFMAFPSAGQIDFSSISGGPSTTGSDGFMAQSAQFSGVGTIEEQNMAAGFPFPMVNGGNVDLDHGWDWFGVGAPTM